MTDAPDLSAVQLPADAAARLEENRGRLFTSDLSVNEFLLVEQAGFRPVGLVLGTSVYHVACRSAGGARTWSSTS